jgi:hypothetical protein
VLGAASMARGAMLSASGGAVLPSAAQRTVGARMSATADVLFLVDAAARLTAGASLVPAGGALGVAAEVGFTSGARMAAGARTAVSVRASRMVGALLAADALAAATAAAEIGTGARLDADGLVGVLAEAALPTGADMLARPVGAPSMVDGAASFAIGVMAAADALPDVPTAVVFMAGVEGVADGALVVVGAAAFGLGARLAARAGGGRVFGVPGFGASIGGDGRSGSASAPRVGTVRG